MKSIKCMFGRHTKVETKETKVGCKLVKDNPKGTKLVNVYLVEGYCQKCNVHLYWVKTYDYNWTKT